MFTTRFFYDAAVVDAPAGPAAPVDIASIMVKSGRLTTPGNEGEIPKVNTTEKKEDTPPASAPAPATANQTQPADKGKPEPPKPTEAPAAAKPQTEAAPTVPTWQEVLKQQQPNAVLRELGYGEDVANFLAENKEIDPKLVGFLKHWKQSNGDVGPYLKALSTDYGKMAPEDVMRHQLQMQNPELDAKQLDTLYKVKVTQRYKLDPVLYSEEEVEEGRIELMADVKSIRQALATEQQNYLFPKPPEAKSAGPSPEDIQRQQEGEAYRQHLQSDPYTLNLLSNNKLVIGEGDDSFEYPIDSAELSEVMYNPDKWAENLIKDGKPDTVKNWLLAGVAKYGMDFFTKMAQHYKTLGGKSAIAPIENAKPPGAGAPAHAEVESKDPAAAMAKRGRITRGGE